MAKDPFSSRPFTDDDLKLVIAAADATVVRHRDGSEDPHFAGRLLRILATFGPHISVLSGGVRQRTDRSTGEVRYREDLPLSSEDLRFEAGRLYLAWRRPKTGKAVLIPVPADMRPWLGDFLDEPRWRRRQSYGEMMRHRIEPKLAEEGHPILLTPSRFRHTAAVRLRKMGLLDEDVQDFLGITAQTMKNYVNRSLAERTADLEARGWDHSPMS